MTGWREYEAQGSLRRRIYVLHPRKLSRVHQLLEHIHPNHLKSRTSKVQFYELWSRFGTKTKKISPTFTTSSSQSLCTRFRPFFTFPRISFSSMRLTRKLKFCKPLDWSVTGFSSRIFTKVFFSIRRILFPNRKNSFWAIWRLRFTFWSAVALLRF